jgi:uncharacterized protein (TIGR02231 family)
VAPVLYLPSLQQGQNHVHIERLPSCVNGDSIRVDGTGSAIIFDVVHHAPAPASHSNNLNDETIAAARRSLEALQKERDITREQSEFLTSYGRTLDSKNLKTDEMQSFLDMFVPRQVAVVKRIQELDIAIEKAEAECDKLQRETYADVQGEKRGTKITITVHAEVDGNAELTLTYGMFGGVSDISKVSPHPTVVSDASWTPLYDLRASIAKSPDAASKVVLHYRASITQTTGENWSDVALTLSTASPQLGSKVPTLSSWRIGFPGSFMRGTSLAKRRSLGVQEQAEPFDFIGFKSSVPMMAVRQAHVASAGVLNATFGIPGRSDIPSDESSHKVVITVLDLQADLEWICVPREKESVFLTVRVHPLAM